jgi:tetratricopeptide (TPR) repeat protein
MSELLPPDASELISCLSVPVPGLLMLRYRSALVLDALIQTLRTSLPDRQVDELRFDPRSSGPQGAPGKLLDACRTLAREETPIIILRPEPGATADMPELATFWKQLNSLREPLGSLPAQVLVCLDQAHTAAAFHHGKDLISWCSPKFEFLDLTPVSSGSAVMTMERNASATDSATFLTWQSLYPLWRQVLESGQKLTADTTTRLLIPMLHTAAQLGMVTQGSALIREAVGLTFHDEYQRAHWLSLCGDLAVVQGDLAGAMRYFTESQTIAEHLSASDPANAVWQREFSVSLNKLGDLAVTQGNLSGALRYFTQAKAIAERLAASDPTNAEWQRDRIISFERLGHIAREQGDIEGAVSHFEKSRLGWTKLITLDSTDLSLQRGIIVPLNGLGSLALAQGDLTGALRYFKEVKTIAERFSVSDPSNAAWQRDLSVSLNKLGDLAVAQDDLTSALRYFTEAKAIAERLAASDPANAAWQRDLSVSLSKLGDLTVVQGDLAGALRYFTESKILRERLTASGPTNAEWQRDLSVSHFKLSQVAQKQGNEEMRRASLQACFNVLDGMKQRGLHMDPQMAQVYEKLAGMFGETSSSAMQHIAAQSPI